LLFNQAINWMEDLEDSDYAFILISALKERGENKGF